MPVGAGRERTQDTSQLRGGGYGVTTETGNAGGMGPSCCPVGVERVGWDLRTRVSEVARPCGELGRTLSQGQTPPEASYACGRHSKAGGRAEPPLGSRQS